MIRDLIDRARTRPGSTQFREAVIATLGEKDLQAGTAAVSEGADALFAIESEGKPVLFIDETAVEPMEQIHGTKLWFAAPKLKTGRSHSFHYILDGKRFGGKADVPAHGPDSYARPGVPQGRLSEKIAITSGIYDGMQSDYWIYVPAQYDPKTPAALMVWQDGHFYNQRDSSTLRVLDVIDNLIHRKKIPVMIQVFTSPGDISMSPGTPTYDDVAKFAAETGRTLEDAMRSVEYDTVSDRYARFLRDELLAEVGSKYNLRKDGYSRAISGLSSGGICAFNVAWWQPDQFSRVLSWIGSYGSIQWRPGVLDGGNLYPFKVRKEPKRNIRVWLQDGSEDVEVEHGSWPLQNIQLANSLKMREYDFHFSFGQGAHNSAQGSSELPESMAWLWRDYDPSKTEQTYQMEEAEKSQPYFRVSALNRE